jgi:hypothetical protein
VFQTLDPSEMTLDFSEPVLFQDVESGREVYVDPSTERARYVRKLQAHLSEVQGICARLGIEAWRLTTDQPLEIALGDFLRSRQRLISRAATRRRART